MAKQIGIIKIKGTIDDITFYKSQDGYIVRKKSGVSADRIKNDAEFIRTQENMKEFRSAAKSGKLIRTPFKRYTQKVADKIMVGRFMKVMMSVVKSDPVSVRGERSILHGNLGFIEGFEFNNNSVLSNTIITPYNVTVDRITGSLKIRVPSFIPMIDVTAPTGTTHLKFMSVGCEFDFANGTYKTDSAESIEIPLNSSPTAVVKLNCNLTANSTLPFFLGFGVQFFQDVNGIKYPLNDGSFNCLSLVKVLI